MWVNYYFMGAAIILLALSFALACTNKYISRSKTQLEAADFVIVVLLVMGISILVVTVLFSLIIEVGYKNDILLWIEKKGMMQQVIEAGGDLDNIGITQTKIDFNNWLADAKISLERWGTWSTWWPHKEVIESLEYWM